MAALFLIVTCIPRYAHGFVRASTTLPWSHRGIFIIIYIINKIEYKHNKSRCIVICGVLIYQQ